VDSFLRKIKTIFERDSLENPSVTLTEFLTGGTSVTAGVNVGTENTLGLPAIWRGVRLMSSIVASLPLDVYQRTKGGKERIFHTITPLLKNPNEFMTGYTWREVSMFHAHFWGNAYSLISRRKGGVPTEILPFEPTMVNVGLANNKLVYTFKIGDVEQKVDPINVLHIKGLGTNGIEGKSIFTLLKENLGLAIAQQQNAATFYGSGSKLSYAITMPGVLSQKALENLRRTWRSVYVEKKEDVAFLDVGMDLKKLSATPEEGQAIESRKFSVTDIARILGIPPPLLFDLERATFSNISELLLSFTKFDLLPWLANIEAEFNRRLFKLAESESVFCEHNVEGLLRGDPAQRATFYQQMIMNGVFNRNEVRSLENRNPYPGGDEFLIPSNLIKSDELGKEKSKKNGQILVGN